MWSESLVLYDEEPDATAYAEHVELCRQVPGATFRHGKVFGSPMGEPAHRYYAEWEFAGPGRLQGGRVVSMSSWRPARTRYKRGFPQPTVEFVSLD